MWTGIERGKRIIVGGYSPHISVLPRSFLKTGAVIGINQWGAELHCDYWIGLDTGLNWEKYATHTNPVFDHLPKFLPSLFCPKFMRRPNNETELMVPPDAGIFFDRAPFDRPINTEWNGQLRQVSSTAMSAIHLAIILGASEVVLYGVDFVGSGRADGTRYLDSDGKNFWDPHEREINNLMRQFQELVPVYKLHPESWLDCPLMQV